MKPNREWIRVDRKKRNFERYYEGEFYKALFAQIEPILENIQFIQTPQELEQRFKQIKADPIRKVFLDLYTRVGLDFMKDVAYQLKGEESELQTKEIDIPTPQSMVQDPEAFTFLWTTEVNNWVYLNVGDRIVSITDTSIKEAIRITRNITAQAIEQGLSIEDTMRLLEREIPVEWRKQRFRARTIARTEVLTASNEGSFRGARATGLPLQKVWLARLDGRERDAHRIANGQSVDLLDPFIVDGEPMAKPGDIRASAGNVINCRCVMTYEVKRT